MLHDVFSKEEGSATVPMCSCLWTGVHGAVGETEAPELDFQGPLHNDSWLSAAPRSRGAYKPATEHRKLSSDSVS